MVLSLKELSFINMPIVQIKYPYMNFEHPRYGYVLEDIIFRCGRRIIINELRFRDEFIDRNWPAMRNHHCCFVQHSNEDIRKAGLSEFWVLLLDP